MSRKGMYKYFVQFFIFWLIVYFYIIDLAVISEQNKEETSWVIEISDAHYPRTG